MNCRNGERFVYEAIQSVLQQSMGDFELVFWDNRSTDSTAEIVKGIPDTRIRYFLSDYDDPLGQARNRAFAEARGQWIALLTLTTSGRLIFWRTNSPNSKSLERQ